MAHVTADSDPTLAPGDGSGPLEIAWQGQDLHGVDLTLLRDMLQLPPIERLRRMERHARDIQALMAYGQRHRDAKAR